MGRKYHSPPLVEALCEFQFEPTQSWDLTIPGLLYERIREEFPKKQQQEMVEVEFRAREAKLEEVKAGIARLRFLRLDETALVQVGPHLLAINHLRPYPTWAQFRPMILKHLSIYRDLAEPKGLRRIGLRYINRIGVPNSAGELVDHVRLYPPRPEGLRQSYESFLVRLEMPYGDGRDRLLLTFAATEPQPSERAAAILDLDYVMRKPDGIALTEVDQWLQEAHDRLEDAFEACITSRARVLFEEVKG